jgi:hypothetical protein
MGSGGHLPRTLTPRWPTALAGDLGNCLRLKIGENGYRQRSLIRDHRRGIVVCSHRQLEGGIAELE